MGKQKGSGSTIQINLFLSRQVQSEILRFLAFLLMGSACALFNLLIVGILTVLMHWSYLPAALIATEASVFLGFLLNDRFTFRDLAGYAGGWLSRCLRFHGAAAAGQLLTLVLATGPPRTRLLGLPDHPYSATRVGLAERRDFVRPSRDGRRGDP